MIAPYYSHDGITLYHGDCRDVMAELEPDSVDLVFTDPPWLKEDSSWSWAALATGAKRLLKPQAALFAFCGHIALDAAMRELTKELSYWWLFIVRNRQLPRIHSHKLAACFKPVLAFAKGLPPKRFNERTLGDELSFVGKRAEMKHLHPWAQPEVCAPILWYSPPGGLVLDPFAGSGTVLRSAKDCGRRAIGIEIEERCCETIAKRLQQEVFEFTRG